MNTKERKGPSGTSSRTRRAKRPPSQTRRNEDVVYTAPGPFKRERFILQLLTVVAVVLALLFGMSIFFKVGVETDASGAQIAKIYVSGTNKYTAHDVVEASGIKIGENLLTIRETEVSGRVMEQLPYVTKVRVRIKLPDTVNIEITETDVTYSVEAADGSWWLIRADGKVLDKTNAAEAELTTKVIGVKIASPVVGEQAVAFEQEQPQSEESEATQAGQATQPTQPIITAAEQLTTLLEILQNLESNGVIGDVVSVDVSNLNGISLWYGDRYDVYLGDRTRIDFKISSMIAAIQKMKSYQTGKLDVSFTTMEDQVIYTPFE